MSDDAETVNLAKAFCAWTLPKSSISYHHFLVLRFLMEAEKRSLPVCLGHIAVVLGVSTAAVTNIVDVLEKQDMAERVRNKTDRRQVNVVVRPLGRGAVLHWTNEHEAIRRMEIIRDNLNTPPP